MTALARPGSATASSATPPGQSSRVGVQPRGDVWLRRVALVNLVAQIGIVVTGGIVRLTGSGLGCPTWPECAPGSLVPTAEQTEGVAKLIEFGNRLLTFVVGLAALAVLALALRYRRRIAVLAALPLVGTVGQALLGGVTVLTGLHPATVAAHFLLSMVLIAVSTVLLLRVGRHVATAVPRRAAALMWATAVVGAAVIILGTVVTGTGPHSGDADEASRFAIDPVTISMIHADTVLLFCALLVTFLVVIRRSGVGGAPWRRGLAVLGVTLAQGVIGYVQYFSGVPRPLVSAHMLGACLLVVAITALVVAVRPGVRQVAGGRA